MLLEPTLLDSHSHSLTSTCSHVIPTRLMAEQNTAIGESRIYRRKVYNKMVSDSITRNVWSSLVVISHHNLTHYSTKGTQNKENHSCTDDYFLLSRTAFVSQKFGCTSTSSGNPHLWLLTSQWQKGLTDHHYEPSRLICSRLFLLDVQGPCIQIMFISVPVLTVYSLPFCVGLRDCPILWHSAVLSIISKTYFLIPAFILGSTVVERKWLAVFRKRYCDKQMKKKEMGWT